MNKKYIYAGVAVAVLATSVLLISQQATKSSDVQAGDSAGAIVSLGQFETTPILYSGAGLDWKSQARTYTDAITYNNSGLKNSGDASLVGTEWSASLSGLSGEQVAAVSRDKFEKFYQTELAKNGWSSNYENVVSGYTIHSVSADGALGSVYGYIKVIGNRVQVLILTDKEGGAMVDNDGPIQISAPFTLSYKVFLSDPMDIKDIVNSGVANAGTVAAEKEKRGTIIFADQLSLCAKYKSTFIHPLTKGTMQREILGIIGGKCDYIEQMPNGGKMECKYTESERKAVAQYYKDVASAESYGASVNIGSNGATSASTINGKVVKNPLAEAMSNGTCVISGY